uniref:PDZ domain-containing protein n=1 Tax=Macrostomum lignano TaxID=282301 RepID=A0A1I8FM06_9PLAT
PTASSSSSRRQQSCAYSTPKLWHHLEPGGYRACFREQQRPPCASLLSRYAKDRHGHSLNVVIVASNDGGQRRLLVVAHFCGPQRLTHRQEHAAGLGAAAGLRVRHRRVVQPSTGETRLAILQPPATSSHARQASDLSQLTIDTGTSGDNVSLRMATTPPRRHARTDVRCSLSRRQKRRRRCDQEEAKMREEEELPPIPSALERTLKLRKSGFEELGLVIARGEKGTNGLRVTEVLRRAARPLAAAPSSTGDYVTAVNSESLRRVRCGRRWPTLGLALPVRAALELSDISVSSTSPRRTRKCIYNRCSSPDRKPKKFSAKPAEAATVAKIWRF